VRFSFLKLISQTALHKHGAFYHEKSRNANDFFRWLRNLLNPFYSRDELLGEAVGDGGGPTAVANPDPPSPVFGRAGG